MILLRCFAMTLTKELILLIGYLLRSEVMRCFLLGTEQGKVLPTADCFEHNSSSNEANLKALL